MDAVTSGNVALYVFSFNRGQFLDNCLKSVKNCAEALNTTIIDDQSDDPSTRNILAAYTEHFRILNAEDDADPEHKTGGLYNNMRFAFRDARERGYQYVIFLQDDMQLVRPILESDLAGVDSFFRANPRAAEIHTCFMKRFFAERDEAWAEPDASGQAYLRPSNYPGFSGFSAVGLFSLERFEHLFSDFRKGEYANNAYAQSNDITMGISARPFMMWLPYPISHRGRERNIPLMLVEGLGGCGYYPYRLMTEAETGRLLSRNIQEKPYAEDWLEAPQLGKVPVWSFAGGLSNLYARGGFRALIAAFLQKFR